MTNQPPWQRGGIAVSFVAMDTGLAIERDRVRRTTAEKINERIDSATIANIRRFATQPRDSIDRRIGKLNEEWDIDRVLETQAAALGMAGVILGVAVNRRWLLLSGTVLGFLLLHGLQGWCPPIPLLRRAGVRTRTEIDREKLALKYLRGDFDGADPAPPQRQRRRLGAIVG